MTTFSAAPLCINLTTISFSDDTSAAASDGQFSLFSLVLAPTLSYLSCREFGCHGTIEWLHRHPRRWFADLSHGLHSAHTTSIILVVVKLQDKALRRKSLMGRMHHSSVIRSEDDAKSLDSASWSPNPDIGSCTQELVPKSSRALSLKQVKSFGRYSGAQARSLAMLRRPIGSRGAIPGDPSGNPLGNSSRRCIVRKLAKMPEQLA